MKLFLFAAVFALAGHAMGGEDSTDHWGAGGTGPAWYQTPCGLADFPGPLPFPDRQRCGRTVARDRDNVGARPASKRRYGAGVPETIGRGAADRGSKD